MKASILLLGLSLAANGALGAWLLLRPAPPIAADAPAPTRQPAPPPAPPDPLATPITAESWGRWSALPPADYAARLRAEGLPPAVVRALLRARFAAGYADRLRALSPPPGQDEYWRRSFQNPDNTLNAAARAERRRIFREVDDAVRASLGPDADALTDFERAVRLRNFGPLSAAQVEQLTAIQRDYADLRTQVRDNTQGVLMADDRAQLRLLEEEQRKDLAALLSPAELLEYDLRNSDAAGQVRNQTRYFEPTEEEYRALVQLRLAFNRQYGGSNLSEEEQAAKRAAEQTYQNQVAGLLSPDRYAEYELTTNRDFQSIVQALGLFNFDVPVAREVMALRTRITTRAAAIQENALLSREQRAAELGALYREASSELTTKLGAKAYEAFERQGAGNWLRKLAPAPNNPGGSRP